MTHKEKRTYDASLTDGIELNCSSGWICGAHSVRFSSLFIFETFSRFYRFLDPFSFEKHRFLTISWPVFVYFCQYLTIFEPYLNPILPFDLPRRLVCLLTQFTRSCQYACFDHILPEFPDSCQNPAFWRQDREIPVWGQNPGFWGPPPYRPLFKCGCAFLTGGGPEGHCPFLSVSWPVFVFRVPKNTVFRHFSTLFCQNSCFFSQIPGFWSPRNPRKCPFRPIWQPRGQICPDSGNPA